MCSFVRYFSKPHEATNSTNCRRQQQQQQQQKQLTHHVILHRGLHSKAFGRVHVCFTYTITNNTNNTNTNTNDGDLCL